jgi:His/Glu/Gln/Arg/opine family amino acid ABC transporter permease subunit
MFDTALTWNDLAFLAQGAAMTLAVTAVSVTAGTVLGIVFGVLRVQLGPLWSAPLTFVLDVFRSVPLLIQLVLGNALQAIAKLGWAPFTTSCVVLSLYTAAYCSEIVRGGIGAVPATTRRAARSLGMSWWQDMRYIVAPLATRVSLPAWIGLTLGVMKDSALVLWLGPHRAVARLANSGHPLAGAAVHSFDLRRDLLRHQLPHRPAWRVSRKTVVPQ